MAHHSPSLPLSRMAAAVALVLASSAGAQAPASSAVPQAEIVITSPAPQQVSGFGDVPLSRAPFSATNIDGQTLRDLGASRISDALRLDASVSDAYNSPAYWDQLSVRGYTLDNKYNYRREGLPISAESMIPMENKERIELFKGTSGIQAGTSAPGGLANYVIKRAPAGNNETIRSITASYGNGKSSSLALDLGARFGESKDFGYRFNAAYEDLNPYIRNAQGHRNLVALAMDWRITPDSKLEWEFEHSERQQIGVNGYSLLGNTLPATVNGKRNLTWQDWALPGVFNGNTGSIRFRHNLSNGWLWTTRYGAQRLKTDDRLPFAYGCAAESWWDRFCNNGSFDLYDFRSDNERRKVDALQTELNGQATIAGLKNDVAVSVMRYRMLLQTQPYAYNATTTFDQAPGTGSVFSDFTTFSAPTPLTPNTSRSEYFTELAFRDRISINDRNAFWLGLRHTLMDRSSRGTDGGSHDRVKPSFTTPWLAMTHEPHSGTLIYGSYGEGIEVDSAPSLPSYNNAGQPLPALRSKQFELGLKSQSGPLSWQVAWFGISRPQSGDACDGDRCTRQIDGETHNSGLEVGVTFRHGPWLLEGSGAQVQSVRKNASINPSVNGQRAINVPQMAFRSLVQYRWANAPGLRTSLRVSHEGRRPVLADGSLQLPAWTTLDLSAHYSTRLRGVQTDWTLGLDNLADRRYWREAPLQFGHHYLYPGAPRTLRVSMQAGF